MFEEFNGQVVFLTGGGKGIGKTTALMFAKYKAKIFLVDINLEAAEETSKCINENGGVCHAYQADISIEKDVKGAVDKCTSLLGDITYAHNNAGIVISANTENCTEENWEKVINTNLKGTWFCMKYEIKNMKQKQRGSIVNTASISGLTARKGDMPYVVSKHGIIGLTKTAALENAQYGIRINAVCPGAINTDWVKRVTKGLNEMHPLGRIGTTEEVANAVLWLSSDQSSFVTGHSLVIDGGRIAGESK